MTRLRHYVAISHVVDRSWAVQVDHRSARRPNQTNYNQNGEQSTILT